MSMLRSSLLLLVLVVAGAHATAPAPRPYVYRVVGHEVVDGDTMSTELDLGFDIRLKLSARLQGLDAPEPNTRAGELVKQFVAEWIGSQQTILAESVGRDKYAGRYVARIHGDAECLNDLLLTRRLVRLYDGGTRREWSEVELRRIEAAAERAIRALKGEEEVVSESPPTRITRRSATSSAPRVTPLATATTGSETVYVTASGSKYHRAACRHLAKSSRAMTREAAHNAGYAPCAVCRP